MDRKAELLAHKYAQAFLQTWPDAVEQMHKQLHEVYEFLKKDRAFAFISKLPASFGTLKKERLQRMLEPFNLSEKFDKLIDLIIQQQRLVLLPDIVKSLTALYQQKHHILPFTVYSSHSLNNQELSIIDAFLHDKTEKQIVLNPSLATNLIAGIRLQSDTLLWEYSIAKQLNNIERSLDNEHKKF